MGATRSPSGVSLGFIGLLGLGLLLPSKICVVVGEAERVVRRRVGEGVAVSFTRVLLKAAPSVLLLLRRADLGGRHAAVWYHGEGDSVLLRGVPSRLSSSSLVGQHAGAAPCLSSSMLELRVLVVGSPRRRIRGHRLSIDGVAAGREGVAPPLCLCPCVFTGFRGMRLITFCVKGWYVVPASPAMVVAAVCFRSSGTTAADLFFPSNSIFAGGRCSFNIQVASRWRFRMPNFANSSRVDASLMVDQVQLRALSGSSKLWLL
jgi:hypothetical protein